MSCDFCIDGNQGRFEGGTRGVVKLPCAICRPKEFQKWAEGWQPEPKTVKPAVQQSMFMTMKTEEYPE